MIIFNWVGMMDLAIVIGGIMLLEGNKNSQDPWMNIAAGLCFLFALYLDVSRRLGEYDSRSPNPTLHMMSLVVSPTKGGMLFFIPTWLVTLMMGLSAFLHPSG